MAEQKTHLNVYNILCSPTGEDGKPLVDTPEEGKQPTLVITRLAIVAPNSRAATQKAVAFFQNVAKGLDGVKITGIEVYEFKLEIDPSTAIVVV